MRRIKLGLIILLSMVLLTACNLDDMFGNNTTPINQSPTLEENKLSELDDIDNFREGALEHILEGELNRKGQAVGFHYDGAPSKKGEIVKGTETTPNRDGIYEAEIEIEGVAKTSNNGKSTFFPKTWTTQDVVDAINEAYSHRQLITGNTYEGLTEEGIVIRMYLDNNDLIISAFPVL